MLQRLRERKLSQATAFAPASVGNVAIGFDILGFAVDALGDRVTVARVPEPGVVDHGASAALPGSCRRDPKRNTAGQALLAMQEALQLDFGFAMEIDKGIPLGSGLGGSAASAVAAVVAANALLAQPCSQLELLKFAMQGEAVASGSLHVDNIAPSLFGGLVLTVGIDHPRVKQIPVPPEVRAVIVHPHMFLSTRQARAILRRTVEMSDFVWQTANLAGFISGCYTNDLDMIRASLRGCRHRAAAPGADPGLPARCVTRPWRRARSAARFPVPGRPCSPGRGAPHAAAVRDAMRQQFASRGIEVDEWIVPIEINGARVIA